MRSGTFDSASSNSAFETRSSEGFSEVPSYLAIAASTAGSPRVLMSSSISAAIFSASGSKAGRFRKTSMVRERRAGVQLTMRMFMGFVRGV